MAACSLWHAPPAKQAYIVVPYNYAPLLAAGSPCSETKLSLLFHTDS